MIHPIDFPPVHAFCSCSRRTRLLFPPLSLPLSRPSHTKSRPSLSANSFQGQLKYRWRSSAARIYEPADPRLLIVHPTVNSGVEVHRAYHSTYTHSPFSPSTALGNVNILLSVSSLLPTLLLLLCNSRGVLLLGRRREIYPSRSREYGI